MPERHQAEDGISLNQPTAGYRSDLIPLMAELSAQWQN
jgi:hypothetical protein